MEKIIDTIITGNESSTLKALNNFVQAASQTFTFPELDENKRQSLWNAIFRLALFSNDSKTLSNCFEAIRILSREKDSLNDLITEEWFQLMRQHSGLGNLSFNFDDPKLKVAIEVLKSMSNIIFNSKAAAKMCCQNHILEDFLDRIKHYDGKNVPEKIIFFDVKLIFLLTAIRSEVRDKVKKDLNGVTILIQLLDLLLKEDTLDNEKASLACEALKALFNLTLSFGVNHAEEDQCTDLVNLLRKYLLVKTSKEKAHELKSDTINLLTSMPILSYVHLVTPVENDDAVPDNCQYEGQNMEAFHEMLNFLEDKFTGEITISNQHEILSPVLSALYKGAEADRCIRKYLRLQILPPLKDVHSRPEHGTSLRNCLCRLLTTPITQLRHVIAELLFILCKKNVTRMIKYTGYGNAAGHFALRGLLGGKSDPGEADYSSDSETSDTDEYSEFKHGINPVTGCFEAPHPNPMDNMTEEQKEYEAMQLVELMDSLTKCGTIKPCRIGPDGKPQPIEHVLQLQEGLKSQQINNNESDSD